jgi:hypothetical protein
MFRMTARRLQCGEAKLTNSEQSNAIGQRAKSTRSHQFSINDSDNYNGACASERNLYTSIQDGSDLNHTPLCTTLGTLTLAHPSLTWTHRYTLEQHRQLLAHIQQSSILSTTLTDLAGVTAALYPANMIIALPFWIATATAFFISVTICQCGHTVRVSRQARLTCFSSSMAPVATLSGGCCLVLLLFPAVCRLYECHVLRARQQTMSRA